MRENAKPAIHVLTAAADLNTANKTEISCVQSCINNIIKICELNQVKNERKMKILLVKGNIKALQVESKNMK